MAKAASKAKAAPVKPVAKKRNNTKAQLLGKTVEHVDITSYDARPIIDSMRKMSFSMDLPVGYGYLGAPIGMAIMAWQSLVFMASARTREALVAPAAGLEEVGM